MVVLVPVDTVTGWATEESRQRAMRVARRLGYSQATWARLIGLSPGTWRMIRSGYRPWTAAACARAKAVAGEAW